MRDDPKLKIKYERGSRKTFSRWRKKIVLTRNGSRGLAAEAADKATRGKLSKAINFTVRGRVKESASGALYVALDVNQPLVAVRRGPGRKPKLHATLEGGYFSMVDNAVLLRLSKIKW